MSSLARAAKKQKTSHSSEAQSPGKVVTPMDAHFNRLNKFFKEHGYLGHILIRGIEDDESEIESDEEEVHERERTYTEDQMSTLRHILMNKSREKAIDHALNFVTCGQANEGFMMLDTTTGNNVCFGLPTEVKKCMND